MIQDHSNHGVGIGLMVHTVNYHDSKRFIISKMPKLKLLFWCSEYKYLQVSKQAFEFTIGLEL